MNYNLDDFFINEPDKSPDKSIEEKKSIINDMVSTLNYEQLSQVINFLKEPFFTHKLKEYLLDSKLPPVESKEFLFLVQSEKYNGNIVKKLMNKVGISDYYLDKFIHKYKLQEISNNTYIFPHKSLDAPFVFQAQYSRAVISHESALYMLNLTDVISRRTIMSMPKNYNFSQLEKKANHAIKIHSEVYNNNKSLVFTYSKNDPILLTKNDPIGNSQIVMRSTNNNNLVQVTSAERTIADILTPNSKTEEEVKYEALRQYYTLYPRDSKRLRRIAYQQGVLEELDKYLWELQLH